MPQSARLVDYRAALTTQGARGPVVAALLGRLPIAMVAFSLLLYVQRVTGTYAIAGLVSAAALVGMAIGSVAQARIIDRAGPTHPLLATTGVFAVFIALVAVAVGLDAPAILIVGLALGVGLSQPTIGSTSRAMWTRLVPTGSVRNAAYIYEAVVTELYFVLGPALSGLLLTAPWPGTGLVVGAGMMIVGTVWYALTPTMRGFRPDPETVVRRRLLGALASAGLRTVVFASAGMGLIVGVVEVAVPAAASRGGSPGLGGVLLALWSLSSAIFGISYGSRPWPKPLRLRIPALLGGFAVLVIPMAVAGSLVGLAVALLIGGTLITPQTAAHAEAVELVAMKDLVTESFGWMVAAGTLGIGAGHAVSGQIIERAGVGAAFLLASGIGLVAAAALYLRRHDISDRGAAGHTQVQEPHVQEAV